MKSFFEWFAQSGFSPADPWLILGKGPSFSLRDTLDLKPYQTLALNHVVREQPVRVAHVIDLDVIEACGDAMERNAQVVVMPWFPHVKNSVGNRTLEQLAREHPSLQRLADQDRLLWYNLSTGREARGDSPVVRVKYFSAVAVLNLLTEAGVRRVRSLGIDGGATYSPEFGDLKDKTLLANAWSTFDLQFEEMARTLLRTGVDYAPLHVPSPIRVYVAATEKEMLPTRVLEFSIRKHASMTTQVIPLHQTGIAVPTPKDPRNLPRTPFSFQRFLVPAAAGFRGRAIYLDSDMQVFRDLARLWLSRLQETEVLTVGNTEDPSRPPQFSVMLLNCDLLRWDIRSIVDSLDRGELTYEQLMYEMRVAGRIRTDLDPGWNSLERYDESTTHLLHYTDMHTQPWVYPDHPFGHLWMRDLLEAIEMGAIPKAFVEEEVRKGHVRPSLLAQVERRMDEGLLLPKAVRSLDREFSAPFRSIQERVPGGGFRPFGILRAYARSLYHRSPFPRYVRALRRRLKLRR